MEDDEGSSESRKAGTSGKGSAHRSGTHEWWHRSQDSLVPQNRIGRPNRSDRAPDFRDSLSCRMSVEPHDGHKSVGLAGAGESCNSERAAELSTARIFRASSTCSYGTCSLTPPIASDNCQLTPTKYSSAKKAGMSAASSIPCANCAAGRSRKRAIVSNSSTWFPIRPNAPIKSEAVAISDNYPKLSTIC